MTLKGGTSQACAACKYQRRRCTPECALAPHFRPEQSDVFKNAHKLFGVRNIKRILKQIQPNQTNAAMKTIIYEANIRERFPVYGCLAVIGQLNYEIRQAVEELHLVLSQLTHYKQQQQQQQQQQHQQQQEITLSPNGSPESQQMIKEYCNNDNDQNRNDLCDNNSRVHDDSRDNINASNAFWAQLACCNKESQFIDSQPLTIQEETTYDYDEIQPCFETIDDRQSYVNSNNAYETSPSSSIKDTTQPLEHVANDEFKSAELRLQIIGE